MLYLFGDPIYLFFFNFFSCSNYLADLSVSNFLNPWICDSEESFESFLRSVTTVQHNYTCILSNKADRNEKTVGKKLVFTEIHHYFQISNFYMTDCLQWQGQDLLPLLRCMRKPEKLLTYWHGTVIAWKSAVLIHPSDTSSSIVDAQVFPKT